MIYNNYTKPNDIQQLIYNNLYTTTYIQQLIYNNNNKIFKNISSISLVKSKFVLQYSDKHCFGTLDVLAYMLHLLYQLLEYFCPFLVVLLVFCAFNRILLLQRGELKFITF